MRRNRTKSNKKATNNKVLFGVLFLVVLPLLSVSIGYFGVKYFLLLSKNDRKEVNNDPKYERKLNENINKLIDNSKENTSKQTSEPESDKDTTKKYSMDIPALSIFNIQVGSFSEKAYAEKQISQMKEKGLKGHIVGAEGYKVIAMSFLDRELADKYKESIREIYSDAFIAAINLPVRKIAYTDSGKRYANVASGEVKRLINYYNNFNSFLANNKLGEMDISEVNQFVDKQLDLLSKIENSISNVEPTKDFSKFNSNLLDIVNNSKNSLEQMKKNNFSDRLQLMKIFMESLNKYPEIIY